MVKVITTIRRKEGMSQEEFSRYWEENHGPLIKKILPGVKRYVQNHARKLPGGGEPKIDGVVEIWFEDMDAWRKAAEFFEGEGGKAIITDEEKFIDRSSMVFFVAEEKVIVG
jgi:uncharacterized protein (TIGR02118 family)